MQRTLHTSPWPPELGCLPSPSSRGILMLDNGSDVGVGLLLLFRIWGHAVHVVRDWRVGVLQARSVAPGIVIVNLDLIGQGNVATIQRALRVPGRDEPSLVILKDGLPYRLTTEPGDEPRLRVVGTAALKALLRSLVAN